MIKNILIAVSITISIVGSNAYATGSDDVIEVSPNFVKVTLGHPHQFSLRGKPKPVKLNKNPVNRSAQYGQALIHEIGWENLDKKTQADMILKLARVAYRSTRARNSIKDFLETDYSTNPKLKNLKYADFIISEENGEKYVRFHTFYYPINQSISSGPQVLNPIFSELVTGGSFISDLSTKTLNQDSLFSNFPTSPTESPSSGSAQ